MSIVIPRPETPLTGDKEGHATRVWYKYWVQLGNTTNVNIAGDPTGTVGLTAVDGTAATYMRSDAAPAIDPSILPAAANPTAKVGTAAVNGTAATFMRSDAAPPLDLTVHYSFTGPIGVNGATAPAQVTGWGAPTGAAVVNNFSGAAATLVQTSTAVAEIIAYLISRGDFGA